MIIVSVFALIANGICLYILQKSKSKEEAHMKASMIFTSNDVIINLGVIIAGVLVNYLSSSKPDLIIGNKEENTKSDIEKLSQIAPVWMSDIQDLKGAYEMIDQIACLVGETEKGVELVSEIRENFRGLAIDGEIEKSVLYFIWNSPNLIAAKKTFIDEMLQQMGLSNLSTLERYPEVDYEAQPDLVFLSSEPFPFKEKHVKKFKSLYPAAKIIIVDGEMFSWYGSRLKHAPNYFQKLLKQIAID